MGGEGFKPQTGLTLRVFLEITEKNVPPLLRLIQMVRCSSLLI